MNLDPLGRLLPCLLHVLNIFLDWEWLICSNCQINRSSHFGYNVKNHLITKLIFMDSHSRCSHMGVGSTLVKLRCISYWVFQGRQTVKTVLISCAWYKRFNTRPVMPSNVASLSVPHFQFEVPFKNLEIDFMGHLWVKEGIMERKMYLLLFTCLNVREVHIEVVLDKCFVFLPGPSPAYQPVWYS